MALVCFSLPKQISTDFVFLAYKLRTQIVASIKRRSEAIQNALITYNKLARLVTPPREALSWDTVIKYSFLGEFELLRFAREDIRDYPWAKPAIREGVMSYYKLLCARKEIERLNVEVPRLHTSI